VTEYLEVRNLDKIIGDLGKLDDLIGELAEPTEETLKLLKERMQEYPAERDGQKYVRTFELQNGWDEYVILAGDRLGLIYNATPYGPRVQAASGDPSQAWMHEGRWQTDEQVIKEKEEQVQRIYEAYLRKLMEKIG
jgi:hypothetical protein